MLSLPTIDEHLGLADRIAALESRRSPRVVYNVKDYGAVGDGVTDDRNARQEAIDAAHDGGGGIVYAPPGVYINSSPIWARNGVTLLGEYQRTIFKAQDGSESQIIANENAAQDIPVDDFSMLGLIFDGNKANQPTDGFLASAVGFGGVRRLRAKDCTFRNARGYGLGIQAAPNQNAAGPQEDIYLENCQFLDNGDGDGASVIHDGLDVKDCKRLTMISCYASGNALDGMDLRGDQVSLFGCRANNNGGDGFELKGNSHGEAVHGRIDVVGCAVMSNGGAGFHVADGSGGSTVVVEVNMMGNRAYVNQDGLIWTESTGNRVELNVSGWFARGNSRHGIFVQEENIRSGQFSTISCEGNGGDGFRTQGNSVHVVNGHFRNNDGWGFNEAGTGRDSRLYACMFAGNTFGDVNHNGNLEQV